MQKIIKIISASLFILFLPLLVTLGMLSNFLPDFFIMEDERAFFKVGDYPVHVQASTEMVTDAEKSLTTASGEAEGQLMLGIIPIKPIHLQTAGEKEVIITGMPFGIKLFTKGVLVVGTGEVETASSTTNPGKEAGLRAGDVILSLDRKTVHSNEDTAQIIENSEGRSLSVHYSRHGKEMEVLLRPAKSALDGRYKAGLWIRDSTAGIGTMTFVDPRTGVYGGLGHGVCDVDTGELMPMSDGEIVPVSICGITKGLPGAAGELLGFFSDEKEIGTLERNTVAGVYGRLRLNNANKKGTAIKIAYKQDVVKGPAQILSTISGQEARLYDIVIERVNYDKDTPSQNMVIRITDPELLKLTGGIVQGMSGSPIIQNGKLIGAITHVFVNDPSSGYGIFAENMLEQSKKITKSSEKRAS